METIIYRDRRDTNSYKWDHLGKKFSRDGLLPLWVADMDFAAPQCVREALKDRAEFGVFGYELAPVDCDAAFLQWERSRHGYDVKPEWVRHAPGVVAGLNWLIQAVTEPGDGVLIQTPVYYPFMSAVTDHGRRLVKNELVNTNGVYTIVFADFERKITEERVRAFILCSPHNPVGRVWTRAELEEMLTICCRHGVTVISDEIHQDFVWCGHPHIPAASLETGTVVTLTAPSKTFNLAGLKAAFVVIPDAKLRRSFDGFVRGIHAGDLNSMGLLAAEAAYNGGGEWLDQIRTIIRENDALLRNTLAEKAPGVVVTPLEGTYLAWVDLGAYVKPEELERFVEGRCGLAVDYGSWFGGQAPCHIRINLATRPEIVRQAALALAENL